MKSLFVVVLAALVTTSTFAQSPSLAGPGATPNLTGGPGATTRVNRAFIMNAVKRCSEEVELAKLAAERGMREEVEKFAQMMLDDHSKAADELKAIALRKDISWSTAELDPEYTVLRDRLATLSADAFDRAYMQAMVTAHREMADEFRLDPRSEHDPDVRAWAAKTMPTVEEHLARAQDLARMLAGPGSTQ